MSKKNEDIKSREELGINIGESIDFDTIISSIPKNIMVRNTKIYCKTNLFKW